MRLLGSGPGKAEQWGLLVRPAHWTPPPWSSLAARGTPRASAPSAKGSAPTGIGHSVVVSPLGEVLEELDGAPGLLFADLDTTTVKEARTKLPVLANRHKF